MRHSVGLVSASTRRKFRGLALLSAVLAACGDEGFEPALRYRMIGLPAAAGGACPADAPDEPPAIPGATRARLTYLDEGTDTLRCDVVLALGAASVVAVPDAARPVDLVVEYLDDAGAVVGRGEARGIDLGGAGAVEVRVRPAGAFACATRRALAPRAFHSATPLPNGDLLLLGGVAGQDGAETIDPAAGFFLQPGAELYSVAEGRTRPLTIPNLVPRAFHEAYVVASDATGATIAVIGGLTVTGDPATTPVAVVGASTRLAPAANAAGAPGELLRYDAATGEVTRMGVTAEVQPRAFGALPPPGSPAIAYVGGLAPGTATARGDADRVAISSGEVTGAAGLRRPRIGATVTALDADRLLVWGGDTTAGVPMATPELGELLIGWAGTPAAQPLTFDPTSATAPHRAFGAAALAGDGAVILYGGFLLDQGAALAPVPQVLQRFAAPAGAVILTDLVQAPDLAPVGYGAALALADGDVLVAGGNPDATAAGCDPAHQGLVCASAQAHRYDAASMAAIATGALGVARYGARLAPLGDGTVVASGGLGELLGTLHALVDLEIYEPRGTADDPLGDGVRAAGDVARDDAGAPLAPCEVVTTLVDAPS